MRAALFDVDGTLVKTNGAGMRAFRRAFQQVFDIRVNGDEFRADGKTDPLIAKEMLSYYGQAARWNNSTKAEMFCVYLQFLEDEMHKALANNKVEVLPGVTDVLKRLSAQPDFKIGLATGNLERGARIKLEGVGLDRYFPFGGFSSDAENRTDLIRIAIKRAEESAAPSSLEAAFVIGDTPLDVIHAHAAGAVAIAVASAHYSEAELSRFEPDYLVPSLSPADPVISFMNSWKPE